jgi:peptidyl-prolyl cis-trans isomerase SurA
MNVQIILNKMVSAGVALPRRQVLQQPHLNDTRIALFKTLKFPQQIAVVGVAALCLVGIAGCRRTHGPNVVATVNGKPIMRSEVEQLYENNLGDSQQQPSKEQADIVRLNVIRQLIDEEILMERAAKLNLTATDEEVDNQINELKAPFTQEEFNKRLAAKHLTLDDLKRQIRRSKTEDKLLNKEINSKINITDADISAYYNAHKAEFNLIEPMYHLAQIMVTSQPLPQQQQQSINLQNSKATNDAEAKKKIETLHNRLESGEDFGLLAQNFSERPDTASNGGDMGFVSESQLHSSPEVYAAIGKIKPGQITEILPVYDPQHKPIGYEIFKLLDKQAAGQRELTDPRVQQSIRAQLRDARVQLLRNAYLEMLRDEAHVENFFAEDIFKNGAQ